MSPAKGRNALADVSRETTQRLEIYAQLLAKWNPAINMVGKSTLPDLWTRHFQDSAQIFGLLGPQEVTCVDMGAGGGFPGLVIAILAKEKMPQFHMHCIESDQRKAAFLNTVIRETGLSATVHAKRIEDVAPLDANVVMARALASLTVLLDYAKRHLGPDGRAIFLKGASYQKEVDEALASWDFRLDTYPSETNSGATILKIGDIRRV
ncbi:16S rRNA (guanine(527)-N(7))-methyltransferase RsmG [Sinisalibacter lacisalsi]|uniref:Ribosomal RNA small subunit methyltransferase G n=1 Tax=Sinisalibacter lacisalsi TaxID=1526570 RepID=A0ABQ1QD38_9RHOB|nr:16S rRNA (guanine(527)-N(7))-methyltransferase RsmG [Sinisalibacter lacisalsi]GGD21486.1 ribosomal RNA small subunit methyltransferase G [Sinisalibacter lacisalsi]